MILHNSTLKFEVKCEVKERTILLSFIVIKNDIEKLIVINVYVPCDSAVPLGFIESVYDKMYEIIDNHTDVFRVFGGSSLH